MKKFIYGSIGCLTLFFMSFGAYAQKTPDLSDPEVASAAVVANQSDISFAKVALERSSNSAVREFANTMVKDHSSVIKQAVALVTKLGVTPKDNAVSKSLKKQEGDAVKNLKSVSKKDFDKTYIDHEVAYHKAVINAVEKVLIPDSSNKQLKDLLQGVVPILKTHLAHAEKIQREISK